MILKKLFINNTEFNDQDDLTISNSVSENNSISSFNCNIDNFGGNNKDAFGIHDSVSIFAEKSTTPQVKIFGGHVTSKKLKGESVNESISVEGKDYTSNLMDRTVLPEVYNNMSCGSIVRDIITKYAPEINLTAVGTSLRFDGVNDYARITGSSTNNLGSFSYSFWIKPEDVMSENMFLIRHGTRSFYTNGSGALCGEVASEIAIGRAITNNFVISENTWQHLTMTYGDGEKLPHIYVNGSETGYSSTETGVGSIVNYDELFEKNLAMYDSGYIGDYMYKGSIDEFKIYNKILSTAEIGSEVNNGLGKYATSGVNLVGAWHFDENKGTTAYDLTGNNNHFYLSGLNSWPIWNTGKVQLPSSYIEEGVDLNHVAFNHKPIDEALKYLAEKSGFITFVDVHKNLHFKNKSSVSSGYTFSSGNILSADFETSEDEIKNSVWIYGDRTLSAWENKFTGNGIGSEFIVEYRPHNTQVSVNGSLYAGWPLNMTYSAPSGTGYLVGFDERKIVFISGTGIGNYIPSVGANVNVAYYKDVPLIKYLENNESIINYGKKAHIELNKEITSPQMAYEVAKNIIDRFGEPLKQGTVTLQSIQDIYAGQTCIVDIPIQGINMETFDIISADYDFTPENMAYETVSKIKVSKRLKDVTDTLKQIILDIRKLQGADITSTEILQRYEFAIGSVGIRKNWQVYTRDYIPAGSCGIYDHLVYGIYDAGLVYDGIGGSIFTDFTINQSGGFY